MNTSLSSPAMKLNRLNSFWNTFSVSRRQHKQSPCCVSCNVIPAHSIPQVQTREPDRHQAQLHIGAEAKNIILPASGQKSYYWCFAVAMLITCLQFITARLLTLGGLDGFHETKTGVLDVS